MSGKNIMDHEFKIQTLKATPAVVGTAYAGLTLNEGVALLTGIYIAIQIAYLIWKWRKEANSFKLLEHRPNLDQSRNHRSREHEAE